MDMTDPVRIIIYDTRRPTQLNIWSKFAASAGMPILLRLLQEFGQQRGTVDCCYIRIYGENTEKKVYLRTTPYFQA